MAVSISVVSHRTKRMKLPRRIMPGISMRRAARMRMMMRKMIVSEPVMTAKVKSLCVVLLAFYCSLGLVHVLRFVCVPGHS